MFYIYLIELRNAVKVYTADKAVRALDGIDFTASQGDYISVSGPSGSGKSTLMNILGALDLLSAGAYLFDGRRVSGFSDKGLSALRNKKIGFVFQSYNLIPSLDAVQNVELPLVYRGISPEKRRDTALNALERVGLSERISHRPSELSGGQQQRVAIARAVASSPRLLLADEPTGNLDPVSKAGIMSLLDELNNSGMTVMVITHDPELALRAKRRFVMGAGRLKEI